jgi:dihydropteroate synthase
MPAIDLTKPQIMGILNITEDSFSDGSKFTRVDAALARAQAMVADGASIIDIGAESTRPGASAISPAEQLDKLMPVIEAIRQNIDVAISIDTAATEVMRAVIAAGVDMINDVCALTSDGALELVATANIPVCLMHMQGNPHSMQQDPRYEHVVNEVSDFLQHRVQLALAAGIAKHNIILDPGFGFGKTTEHNLQLVNGIKHLSTLGYPLLIGVSRKSMLGAITGKDLDNRLYSGLAISSIGVYLGANIIRTHDVAATYDAATAALACRDAVAVAR